MPPGKTGTLRWSPTKKTWIARIPVFVEEDGIRARVKKSFDLGTANRAIALIKLERLIAELESGKEHAEPAAAITVSTYAREWLKRREELGIAAVDYERRYLERVWLPAIGKLPLSDLGTADIQRVLDDAAAGKVRAKPRKEGEEGERYSRQSVVHLRSTLDRMLEAAWRSELVAENKAKRTTVPDMEEDGRKRAVLTNPELGQLLAHPEVDAEIKMLVLISRTVAGLRSGDLNALDWTAFGPDFTTCTFVRRKTRKKRPAPETHEVPADVRPFVSKWWEIQGRPKAGPVFPVRRGDRAGKAKKRSNMSYADRLRRELMKAGVTRHELHFETATTLPVDFHSTRRAYATALARAGVNEQTAMGLTGHSDPKVHQRYVAELAVKELPVAALPPLDPDWTRTVSNQVRRRAVGDAESASFLERDTRLELATPSLGSSCSTN
jgi:integrase